MGMEIGLGTLLRIGSTAMSVVGGFVQSGQARAAERDARESANRNIQLRYREIQRQEQEVNDIAEEQRSDRVRKADRELSTLNVVAGEMGASAGSFASLVQELGYFEGLDLSRVERNRERNIEAGEASKEAAKAGYIDAVTIAENQRKVTETKAWSGVLGSGLQIAGTLYGNEKKTDVLRNKKDT